MRDALASGTFFLTASIDAAAHRCASLFEFGDLSTEEGDARLGSRQVRRQTGKPRFAGPLPCRE